MIVCTTNEHIEAIKIQTGWEKMGQGKGLQ